jgi:RNA polymerase sigma factor (TIGR02999 family)
VPRTAPKDITQLLMNWANGDQGALETLMPLVYQELRRLARSHMRRERPGHTLATTGLVHEAYLRLVDQKVNWQSRAHFFGIAAQLMRRILVDHAKSHRRAKRGGGASKVSLHEHLLVAEAPDQDIVGLDEALGRLEKVDPQRGRIVELRFFGGLSNEETAEALGVSAATVQRQWAGARAWLYHELSRQ